MIEHAYQCDAKTPDIRSDIIALTEILWIDSLRLQHNQCIAIFSHFITQYVVEIVTIIHNLLTKDTETPTFEEKNNYGDFTRDCGDRHFLTYFIMSTLLK